MDKNYKENQMLKLNKYAREYIEDKDKKVDYQKIAKQMREFSGAEYSIFYIFDENGKDFTLAGFEGDEVVILGSIANDITDRKEIEEDLLHAHDFMRKIHTTEKMVV